MKMAIRPIINLYSPKSASPKFLTWWYWNQNKPIDKRIIDALFDLKSSFNKHSTLIELMIKIQPEKHAIIPVKTVYNVRFTF